MQWVFSKSFGRSAELLRVSAKAVLLREHEVLMLKKLAGNWDLPGGKIDSGEGIVDGLFREVHEETGLVIKRASLMGVVDRTRPRLNRIKGPLYIYHGKLPRALAVRDVRLSQEHVKASFVPLEEAQELAMSRPCRKALGLVRKSIG